jgi:ATP synthase protein I
MRLSIELVAGAVAGILIGLLLDRWLNSSPWLTILFFFLGCAAGFRNLRRTVELLDKATDSAKTPRA